MEIKRAKDIEVEVSREGRNIFRTIDHELIGEGDNLIITRVVIPKDIVEQRHYHKNVNEFIYFLSPAISIVEGKDYEMKPHDVLILDKGEKHHLSAEKNQVEVLVIKKAWPDKVECWWTAKTALSIANYIT